MKKQTYHATKLKPLVQVIVSIIKSNPSIVDNPDYLMTTIGANIPGFHDKTKCLNCGASMAEYIDVFDINDALLILNMAKIVRDNQFKGMNFTEANKVRVSSADIHHTEKCRTTKCSKLGLIAKAGNAHWAITSRGWDALRGDQVPRMRITFRKQIIERPEETTSISQIFAEHGEKMREKQQRNKSLKYDKRQSFSDYDPRQWVHISTMHSGAII